MTPNFPKCSRLGLAALVVCMATACAENGGASAEGIVSGTITIETAALSGQVASMSAWAFSRDGRVVAYLSPVEGVTCQQVSSYLGSSSEPYDPGDMFLEGYCNLFLLADYDGTDTYSAWDDSDLFITPWTFNCTLDSGEFIYEVRDQVDWDYYWSGRYWQGYPLDWTLSLSGGEGGPIFIETSMNRYDGNFIYEEAGEDSAVGEVNGTTSATWCEELSQLSFF